MTAAWSGLLLGAGSIFTIFYLLHQSGEPRSRGSLLRRNGRPTSRSGVSGRYEAHSVTRIPCRLERMSALDVTRHREPT